jgi:hypothetical protein
MSASFPARVRRAARRLAGRHRGRDPFDRKFDACFEMFDGDCVVVMLMREARTDAALRLGIRLHGNEPRWKTVADAHAHLDDAAITRRAARLRAEGRAETQALITAHRHDTGWYDV